MSRIGIDLGTTNSATAMFGVDKKARIIKCPEGTATMPSAVSIDPNGKAWVGHSAKAKLKTNETYTFQRFKRVMGEDWNAEELDDPQHVPSPDGKIWFEGRKENYSPQHLSSLVIKELLDAAENRLGKRPTGAVLTVPATFSPDAKKATLQAAIDAGLSKTKISLLSEPEAAGLAFGLQSRQYSRIAVYDLGGGTFDISIIQTREGHTDILGSDGIGDLGGANFDDALVDYVVKQFADDFGIDLYNHPEKMMRIREEAEQVKIKLSTLPEVKFDLPMIHNEEKRAYDMDYVISRDVLEDLTKSFVQRTLASCEIALKKAGVSIDEVDDVILVGGMTRMPAVRNAVESFFGKLTATDHDEVELVAVGAAIAAARLDGRLPDVIWNKSAGTVGFETETGAFFSVFPESTKLPTEEHVTLTSCEDNQRVASLRLLFGSDLMADGNKELGLVPFALKPMAAGEPAVDLTFRLDESGKLTVEAGDSIVFEGETA